MYKQTYRVIKGESAQISLNLRAESITQNEKSKSSKRFHKMIIWIEGSWAILYTHSLWKIIRYESFKVKHVNTVST